MNATPKALWSTLALALLTGCGGTEKPLVPVEGKVTFKDGKPLPTGTLVVLNPVEGRVGTASGKTDESGGFKLTHVSGSNGAEVGKYTVQLRAPEGAAAEFGKLVPGEYADGSVLSAEVKEGMPPLELVVAPGKKPR
jgi:hypothetical protein